MLGGFICSLFNREENIAPLYRSGTPCPYTSWPMLSIARAELPSAEHGIMSLVAATIR